MAQSSKVPIRFLIPLKQDLMVDDTIVAIPLFEGNNAIGRTHLAVSDKRISRKHISLRTCADGTTELAVDGQNPIVLSTDGHRKKMSRGNRVMLAPGDIIELIPGSNHLKFTEADSLKELRDSLDAPNMRDGTYKENMASVKRTHEEDMPSVKKSRQIAADEALARRLQDEENDDTLAKTSNFAHSYPSQRSQNSGEAIRHFSPSGDMLSSRFRLLRVQGLPSWANTSSVSIGDVIKGKILVALLSNYMVDIDWLLAACPVLMSVPHVMVIHGESDATIDHLKKRKPACWILHKPPLPISYGTHHSKAMLLVYAKGVRVIIHTANLIHVDWNNKTQGLWMQDFPWKAKDDLNKNCPFENDLVEYLSALKWPEFGANLPSIGHVNVGASFFRRFDYSSATVRLIASVPGYHSGNNLIKWGHMKLRTVLKDCFFNKDFCKSPLVYQFSSLGSLDEKWLAEFTMSTSSGNAEDATPLGLGKPLIIWPTVEDVRCSIEGYAAGSAIPSPLKNVEKEFLKKYWAKWKADHSGRCRAMPHIKTYTRYNGQNLAWFLLTSANLSKAAWGSLQKNSSQLMIRSYELGVLFLPSLLDKQRKLFSCTVDDPKQTVKNESRTGAIKTKLVSLCWTGNTSEDSEIISLPVPYELPPHPYLPEDVPWSWDRRYTKRDVHGQVWPR